MEMVLVEKSFLEKVEYLVQQNEQILTFLTTKEKSEKVTQWVSMKELQEITGWGRSTLETWRDQERFNYKRNSEKGKILYDLESVNNFLEKTNNERS